MMRFTSLLVLSLPAGHAFALPSGQSSVVQQETHLAGDAPLPVAMPSATTNLEQVHGTTLSRHSPFPGVSTIKESVLSYLDRRFVRQKAKDKYKEAYDAEEKRQKDFFKDVPGKSKHYENLLEQEAKGKAMAAKQAEEGKWKAYPDKKASLRKMKKAKGGKARRL
jgi:hypothetical protein